jgi:hypothetical protein
MTKRRVWVLGVAALVLSAMALAFLGGLVAAQEPAGSGGFTFADGVLSWQEAADSYLIVQSGDIITIEIGAGPYTHTYVTTLVTTPTLVVRD